MTIKEDIIVGKGNTSDVLTGRWIHNISRGYRYPIHVDVLDAEGFSSSIALHDSED